MIRKVKQVETERISAILLDHYFGFSFRIFFPFAMTVEHPELIVEQPYELSETTNGFRMLILASKP